MNFELKTFEEVPPSILVHLIASEIGADLTLVTEREFKFYPSSELWEVTVKHHIDRVKEGEIVIEPHTRSFTYEG